MIYLLMNEQHAIIYQFHEVSNTHEQTFIILVKGKLL